MEVEMTATSVGLVQACDDPKLFGFPIWPAQREALAEVEAGPRIHVWAIGRRGTKTTLAALVGLWCCLLRPELRECLRPGERGYAVGVATNLRQARLLVRAALSIVERSPLLGELVESATEDEILFSNGNCFTAFPCSSRSSRGWPVFCLVMDEFAHFLSESEGPQVADRVWEALTPSVSQFGSLARVLALSTPYGTGNLFADLFERASAGEIPDAVARHATTAQMNPTITPELLETERARNPETFRQEYLADFLAGGSAFLDSARIDEAVANRGELDPSAASNWIAGLDAAFSRDPFGLSLVGRDYERARLVLGLTRRWLPPRRKASSFEERRKTEDDVLGEVIEQCRAYRVSAVLIDQHLAPAIVDRLRRAGLPVRTVAMTAQSKTDAFSEVRARLAADELELYGEPNLLAELRRLRTRYTAGRAAVVNPRAGDSHGDQAQALALAVWGHRDWRAGQESGPFDLEADALLDDFDLHYGEML
jgi:hypothetical protein